jgi:hypothetical protein
MAFCVLSLVIFIFPRRFRRNSLRNVVPKKGRREGCRLAKPDLRQNAAQSSPNRD